jgi:hypothetical protein
MKLARAPLQDKVESIVYVALIAVSVRVLYHMVGGIL